MRFRRSRGGTRRHFSRPSAVLRDGWTALDGVEVFYRESDKPPQARSVLHIHGFGMSGRYLVPTAEALAHDFYNVVPDLPGFGRSGDMADPLDVHDLAHATAAFMDDRGIETATLVGNSMGCAVITEFARLHPERIERAVLVAPAGGLHNQPLLRAIRQLVHDGVREPPRLVPVAAPDYIRFGVPSTLRLFRALTQYPSLERLLALHVPTLAVIGNRDPLMPPPSRVRRIAQQQENRAVLVVIEGAAHAINFSHPQELASVIRQFMADQPISDDPNAPGVARAYEIYRGLRLQPSSHDRATTSLEG